MSAGVLERRHVRPRRAAARVGRQVGGLQRQVRLRLPAVRRERRRHVQRHYQTYHAGQWSVSKEYVIILGISGNLSCIYVITFYLI